MRVMTLGGLPSHSSSGMGSAMPIINASNQPYFAASESWSMRAPSGPSLGGFVADIPMPAKHVILGLAAFGLGFYMGRRKKR